MCMYARAYRVALLIVDALVDERLHCTGVARAHRVEQRRVYHPVVCWHGCSVRWLTARWCPQEHQQEHSRSCAAVSTGGSEVCATCAVRCTLHYRKPQAAALVSRGSRRLTGATHHLAFEPPPYPSRVTPTR